jgi:ABC-type uncharacterized transport system YnjBCD substrate-binding protein
MKMHLVALAGLASGFAVFSGCANGDSTSASSQQQKTPVKAQGGYPQSNTFVDWTKPWKEERDGSTGRGQYWSPEQSEAEGYGVP